MITRIALACTWSVGAVPVQLANNFLERALLARRHRRGYREPDDDVVANEIVRLAGVDEPEVPPVDRRWIVSFTFRAPQASSTSATAFEIVGCETPVARAAALNEPCAATAAMYRRAAKE